MNSDDKTLQIAGIIRESIVDGPGYRFTVFTQGCPHNCEGCHNPQTHSFEGGKTATVSRLLEEIKKSELVTGVTFSGGEPFCQAEALADLADGIKANGLDLISYSGYTFEQLLQGANEKNKWLELLSRIDYLIDGKFILAKRSLLLNFRGSSNQRIIDIKKSFELKTTITTEL